MIVILAGLLPAIILIYHIYKADKLQPEPPKQLLRAVYYGVGSIFVSMLFSIPFRQMGFFSEQYTSFTGALQQAFWGAAVPEELAKLIMLVLVIRKNPYFDEMMDGIVYAVCVGMGFAGFENVLYVTEAGNDWMSVSVTRALLSVPCHYYCAVFMGYFFAKFWFLKEHRLRNLFWTLAAPVITHCLYDFICMYFSVTSFPGSSTLMAILLIISCTQFLKWSKRRIAEHLDTDERSSYSSYQKFERSIMDKYDKSDNPYA